MKRENYTRAEIDFVLDYIRRQGRRVIETGEGFAIRNIAGESEQDYNIILLCGILKRIGVYDGQIAIL